MDSVGQCGYGPRVIVRSIKALSKGEEVTIAYTDLLQPKVRCITIFPGGSLVLCLSDRNKYMLASLSRDRIGQNLRNGPMIEV